MVGTIHQELAQAPQLLHHTQRKTEGHAEKRATNRGKEKTNEDEQTDRARRQHWRPVRTVSQLSRHENRSIHAPVGVGPEVVPPGRRRKGRRVRVDVPRKTVAVNGGVGHHTCGAGTHDRLGHVRYLEVRVELAQPGLELGGERGREAGVKDTLGEIVLSFHCRRPNVRACNEVLRPGSGLCGGRRHNHLPERRQPHVSNNRQLR